MAISAATVWEVRTTGSDTANSGGFVAGASGTDYSQQDANQYSATDLVVDGTTNTKVTSVSHSFVAADVGNILRVTSGTGWTAGFYQIVSVSSGAATLDRSPAATSTTGGSYCVGGALASPGQAGSPFVAGNNIYIKSGTYSVTSASNNVAGGCLSMAVQTAGANAGKVFGYGSTRGDGGTRPVIQASGISTFTLITVGTGNHVENVTLDGASLTSSRGMLGSNGTVYRVKAQNCTNNGIFGGELLLCEGTTCSTAGALAGAKNIFCHAYANTFTGFVGSASGAIFVNCLSEYNSGASSDGFYDNFNPCHFVNCTSAGNGRDGFRVAAGASNAATSAINCVAYGNTGYGYNCTSAFDQYFLYKFASGSNTSGSTNNVTSANNVSPITLSANPFNNNTSGGDFGPNSTAGGGASLRAASILGVMPGTSTTTGYGDLGAVQSQASGGTGVSGARIFAGF